jgi:tetratricopeptide (TPR) repeat protein
VIISWIYDIHPEEGIVKTKPAHKVSEEEELKSSNSWRVASYISFVVILVMVGVLLYPKIFKPDRFRELRDDHGMITVAVLPFNNLTGDSSLYYWENGISELLINGLARSDELLVSSSHVVQDVLTGTQQVYAASLSPEIARRTASKISASTHITGNYIGSGRDLSIVLNLVNTEKGELIWTTRVDGDLETDFRNLIDRLSDTVRNYLEIKALEDKVEADLSNAFPNSADAYRHYIDGMNGIVAGNYESAIESLTMAYNIDTTFTFAAFYLAFAYSFSGEFGEDLLLWTSRAYELKNNLPPEYRPWIELWYACYIMEDVNDIRRYCDLMYDAALYSRFLWFDLGVTYRSFFDDFPRAISAYEKLDALNQKWGDDWRYSRFYAEYALTLLKVNRPEEAYGIAERGLRISPGHGWLILYQCSCKAMQGDSAAVEEHLTDLRAVLEKYNATESDKERYTGLMYLYAKDTLAAEAYYRRAYNLDPGNLNRIIILARVLIESGRNIEEGLALAGKGLELYPDDPELLLWKGVALYRTGQHEMALASLSRSNEIAFGYNKLLKDYILKVERALARQN